MSKGFRQIVYLSINLRNADKLLKLFSQLKKNLLCYDVFVKQFIQTTILPGDSHPVLEESTTINTFLYLFHTATLSDRLCYTEAKDQQW